MPWPLSYHCLGFLRGLYWAGAHHVLHQETYCKVWKELKKESLCFLGKKRTLAPATQLLNQELLWFVWQGTAKKQPLADAVFPEKITFGKKQQETNKSRLASYIGGAGEMLHLRWHQIPC